MTEHAILSSLELVNWFHKKANSANKRLNETQVQHLLFLSQLHFILKSGRFLYPSLLVCGNSGFYNPTIRTIMKFGLPFMKTTTFTTEIESFLELIWQKYASLSETDLTNFVLSLDCWKKNYCSDEDIIINPMQLVDSFADSIHQPRAKISSAAKPKIMLSQNGPVKVSAWHPRKLSSSNK